MHLSLRRRILLTLAPLILLLVGLGGAGVVLILNLGNRSSAILHENYRSVEAADRLTDDLGRIDHGLLLSLRTPGPEPDPARAAFDERWPRVRQQFQIAAGNITLPGEDTLVERLRERLDGYEKLSRQFLDLPTGSAERGRVYGSGQQVGLESSLVDVLEVAEEIRRLNEANMHRADQQARQTARASAIGFGAGLVAAVFLAGFLAWRLARGILSPIEEVRRAAQAIGAGQLNLTVPVFGPDELGQLAESFNVMTQHLREFRQSNTARLLRAQRTSQATIDSFADPILVVDPEGHVELANPAARQLLGVAPFEESGVRSQQSEVRGQRAENTPDSWPLTPGVWVPPEPLKQPLADVLRSQRPFLTESFDQTVSFHAGGEERAYLPQVHPIRDEHGGILGAAVVLDDVTRFRLLDRFKSDLVANASHELKTPLTGIRLAVHVLLEEAIGPLTPKQTELLLDARENTERLLRMIESLLSLARLEHGEGLQIQPESPASLLRAAAEAVAGRAEDRHIEVVVQADDGLPPVQVDPVRFGHALGNLLDNALAYTEPGGRVTLSASAADGKVRLSVADTGVGIPPESLPHVFSRFFRVPGRARPPGTGLGLTIVREVVLAHGGEITCESEAGKGTAFHITLPAGRGEP